MQLLLLLLPFCGSQPAGDGGLTADQFLADVPDPCGSGLAREDGLTADQYLSDVPGPTVGAGLPAKAA
ncbi:hypothetical protein D3C72_2383770 [compost metagenome]